MSEKIKFYKMSGAGNDFVVIDNRDGKISGDKNAFAAKVCDRHFSVGADGLLMVEPSKKTGFTMRYYNADGSEADMCGNGARCIARFANLIGAAETDMRFDNLAGEFGAHVFEDGSVRVEMTEPHSEKLNMEVILQGQVFAVHFIDTGVPHAVLEVDNIETAPVMELGRALRHHESFAPAGTNVNFVQLTAEDSLSQRTYERGVEAETLACGTGAVACAVVMAHLGKVNAPVKLKTRGGPVLKIAFEDIQGKISNVRMSGEAKITFEGTLSLPALSY